MASREGARTTTTTESDSLSWPAVVCQVPGRHEERRARLQGDGRQASRHDFLAGQRKSMSVCLRPIGRRGATGTELHVGVLDEAVGCVSELLFTSNLKQELIESIVMQRQPRARSICERRQIGAFREPERCFQVTEPPIRRRYGPIELGEVDGHSQPQQHGSVRAHHGDLNAIGRASVRHLQRPSVSTAEALDAFHQPGAHERGEPIAAPRAERRAPWPQRAPSRERRTGRGSDHPRIRSYQASLVFAARLR